MATKPYMYRNNDSGDFKHKNENDNNINVHLLLDKEKSNNKTDTWNKIQKTQKIQLLNEYVDKLATSETLPLSDSEVKNLKQYLLETLDKKRLQHVKDVNYNKETGEIISIPMLYYNPSSGKYTLKRCEKRASTIKSLGMGDHKSK